MSHSEFAKAMPRKNGQFAKMADPQARFWSKVDKRGPDECWGWRGVVKHTGYGEIMIDAVLWQAHRYAYTLVVGPIPDGKVIDHLCRNRWCVNPAHMEPVTRGENTWRGSPHRIKTHCPHGHEYTPENTVIRGVAAGRPQRVCRTCEREKWRQNNRRRRSK